MVATGGFEPLTYCNTQYFGGYVGLNNSNGRGSMDSLWENQSVQSVSE